MYVAICCAVSYILESILYKCLILHYVVACTLYSMGSTVAPGSISIKVYLATHEDFFFSICQENAIHDRLCAPGC